MPGSTRHRGAALLLIALALLLGLVTSSAFAQTQPTIVLPDEPLDGGLMGKSITAVEVNVATSRWRTPSSVQAVRAGETLTGQVARRAIDELLATGHFADVQARAVPDGNGARLVLDAVPRRIVTRVEIDSDELDDRETLRVAGISTGIEITEPLLVELREEVVAYFQRRGFPNARADFSTTETDDPKAVVLTLVVDAGAPRLIHQRVFLIRTEYQAEVGDLKTDYEVESEDRADEDQLQKADRNMTELLREEGFAEASVRHSIVHSGDHTFLYVYLLSGPRILPAFDGNRFFDDDELESALNLAERPDRKPSDLQARLKTFYVNRGFLDVEIDVASIGEDGDPVHYVAFTIRENSPVRVVRRVFPCLDPGQDPDEIGEEIDSFLEEELPSTPYGAPAPVPEASYQRGARLPPRKLNPASVYAPDTYERAVEHLSELFQSKGYLNAQIGPVAVVRKTCLPESPPGICLVSPEPTPQLAECAVDERGLPLPEPEVPKELTCTPDAVTDRECSPELTLRLPIHLGPQTTLYDIAFEGNKRVGSRFLSLLVVLPLGKPLSRVALEAARQRVLDYYLELGHAYAEVRVEIEPSPDRTRARARFTISEREPVIVSDFVIRGAERTDHDLIFGRLALEKGQPYKATWVRTSEERIATLGTFSSVSIGLEDPEIPQREKRVVITVTEQLPQYFDPRVGFSSGEGLRVSLEYGHRNIASQAIQLTLRVQFSFLPDFIIVDQDVRDNLATLDGSERLERRLSARVTFPEFGLGPLFSLSFEALDVRDNQRDFGLTRRAFIPSITYRPLRQISTTLAPSIELNDVQLFNADSINEAIQKNRSLESLLRVPEGRTYAIAQRLSVSWDRRDNPFSATEGTLVTSGVEHVNAFPADAEEEDAGAVESHFIKFESRVAGYIRFSRDGLALALSLAGGYNFQLNDESRTYPDRLFFLGGVDSLRGFLSDSVVPEDVAQRILNPQELQDEALTIDDVGIRGGDIMINPRAELRIPLDETFQLGAFLDTGNLWVDAARLSLKLRYAAGGGLRINTPIGPLAFDYGVNLERRPWEDFGAFHFSIGLF